MKVRILLVDDHSLVRQGVRLLLESEPDFEVIAEAGDGSAAVQSALKLHPDVMVLDLMLPGFNGIEVAREVKRKAPEIRIVLLSMYDLPAYVIDSLQAGVSAYVLKQSTSGDLAHAIREALAGKVYLSPPLDAPDQQAYSRRLSEERDDRSYLDLTERERQVFLLAAGASNPEIATQLGLGVRTVETHRANLMRKLSLKNQTELVRYAIKHGLVV